MALPTRDVADIAGLKRYPLSVYFDAGDTDGVVELLGPNGEGLGYALNLASLVDDNGKLDPAMLAAAALDGSLLAAGVVVQTVVAGQDETMDATITLTGIAAGDELVAVLVLVAGTSIAARALSDFAVTDDTLTVGANAADNTDNFYVITYIAKS